MSKRIMVADDNAAIRRALRNLLELRKDWIVDSEAVNGRDAVEKAQKSTPDLIVLDVSMPVMNGLEAARVHLLPRVPFDFMFSPYGRPLAEGSVRGRRGRRCFKSAKHADSGQ